MVDRIKVVSPIFRVSFPAVFTAQAFEANQPAKFSVSMLFRPSQFSEDDKKKWKAMMKLANDVSMEKFKKLLKDLPANFKQPIRDGSEKPHLEGYGEGVKFGTASSKMKPGLVGPDRQEILSAEDFYAGCYARATLTCYAYDNKGKGVAFGLNNLQKVKDGESFSGRTDAAEDFADEIVPESIAADDEY